MNDIEILERAKDYVGVRYINGEAEAYINNCLLQAIRSGAAALRAQAERENPQPLTLEQLRERIGRPYYHVSHVGNKNNKWVILQKAIGEHPEDYHYGEWWLAYDHEPKGE